MSDTSGKSRRSRASAPRHAGGAEGLQPPDPMRAYQLYVKVDRAWSWVCTLDAPTHAEAFRQALLCLRGDDHERPIRLEQDIEGAFRKPCNHGSH